MNKEERIKELNDLSKNTLIVMMVQKDRQIEELQKEVERLKAHWFDYKEFLMNKYPPTSGGDFEFTCEHHQKIDEILTT